MWLTGKMFAKHTQGPKFNSQHDKKEEEEIIEVVLLLLRKRRKQSNLQAPWCYWKLRLLLALWFAVFTEASPLRQSSIRKD